MSVEVKSDCVTSDFRCGVRFAFFWVVKQRRLAFTDVTGLLHP